jgi:TPR repeat protein
MLVNGQGVAQNNVEAVKWFRRAAESGHAEAEYNLGLMLMNGQGVTKDSAEALKWYRRSAEQGYVLAQNNLGLMLAQGQGVAPDIYQAYIWLSLAASQDSSYSQSRDYLAQMLTPSQLMKAKDQASKLVKNRLSSR